MSLNRNVRLIFGHTIFTNLIFELPVIIPYYQTIGLSFRDFLIGEAVFSAVVLLAEVPSGWLSDIWRRRTVLMLGCFFAMAGFALLLFADTLLMAATAQGILGIAVALNSGTNTALLYDTLLENGQEHESRRLEGKRHAMMLYSIAGSACIGGFLFTIDPKLPVYMDVLMMLFAMIAIARVREPVRHQKSVEKHMLRDIVETVHYTLRGHAEIGGIILVSMIVFSATKVIMWTQQPYYAMVGIPVAWFGMIMAGMYLVCGVAGHYSHKIEHLGTNRMALGITALCLVIACLVLVLAPAPITALAMFPIGIMAWAVGQPRVTNAINIRVGSERRATILSSVSLMVHVVFIPTSLIVGYIEDHSDVKNALLYVAAQITLLAGAGLWLWGRKKEVAA